MSKATSATARSVPADSWPHDFTWHGRPLVIKAYLGAPRRADCFACGAREDLTSPDARVFLEGTWQPLCDVCRETTALGRMLRHGLRWLSVDLIIDNGISETEWAARGGEPYVWTTADLLARMTPTPPEPVDD